MEMQIQVKVFDELDIGELYKILQLRSEVFVVEQDCVYQDIDGKDQSALHVLGFVNEQLVAYTRVFPPGAYFDQAAIGRVVVHKDHRKKHLGHKILEASIKAIDDEFKTSSIKLSAQTYLLKFYKEHGFESTGQGYLEDGIPHIGMIKN